MKRVIVNQENPNGIEVDLTAEEITTKETENASWETEKVEIANAKQAQEDLKSSAKAKLIAGEALTEEEANTIVL
tara:strand:+ start:590 stop:814 length:225 start_codon:yes stop_codon:yes gene_type:complete